MMTEHDVEDPILDDEELLRDEDETILDAFVRYQRKAAEEGRLAVDALIPEDFKVHGREAKRAFKRSFKVLLEGIVERLEVQEEESSEPPVSSTGKTKVKVEVS